MKTRFSKWFILSLVTASVFFPSCNKLSVDIAKRKYRHGFFVDVSTGRKNSPVKNGPAEIPGVASVNRNEPADQKKETADKKPVRGKSPVDELVVTNEQGTNPGREEVQLKSNQLTAVIPAEKTQNNAAEENKTGEEKKSSEENDMLPLYAGLTGLFTAGLFLSNRKRAKRISEWAKENKWKARAAIAAAQVAMAAMAVTAGMLLYDHGVIVSAQSQAIFTTLFLASVLFYPVKNSAYKTVKSSYTKHKMLDLALVLSGFMMLTAYANQESVEKNTIAKTGLRSHHFFHSIEDKAGEFIRENLTGPIHHSSLAAHANTKAGDAGLIILAVLLFLALLFLLSVVACGISCSGSEGLAVFVFTFGLLLLILFLVLTIRSINKKGRAKQTN
jgi:hypothetical protein